MKKFIYLLLIVFSTTAYSQFTTRWILDADNTANPKDIAFYIAATTPIVNITYTIDGGNPIQVSLTNISINPLSPTLVTLPIPRQTNSTFVNIEIPNITAFKLNSLTSINQGTSMVIDNNVTADKLVDVLKWGDTPWLNLSYAFCYTTNLQNISAIDLPNFSFIKPLPYAQSRLGRMFAESKVKLINRINEWDVNGIRSFESMFEFARNFNDNISNWSFTTLPGTTIKMDKMFRYAEHFNGRIDSWNVTNVNSLEFMFHWAVRFNQPLPQFKPTNTASFLFSALSLNQELEVMDFTGLSSISQFLNSTRSRSPYKNTKTLREIQLDRPTTPPSFPIIGSGIFSYYDPSNTWRNSGNYFFPILGSGTAGVRYYNTFALNPKYTVGTIYPILAGQNVSINSRDNLNESSIGVLRSTELGPEYITDELLDGPGNVGTNPPTTNNTFKLNNERDVIVKSISLHINEQINKRIVNSDWFNTSTKNIINKKDTNIPQDVSVDGTLVYDFTDNHLYVSKGGIWHRADN